MLFLQYIFYGYLPDFTNFPLNKFIKTKTKEYELFERI